MIDSKQLAREMAKRCIEKVNPYWVDCSDPECTKQTEEYIDAILRELNLEQLIADKQRLDWLDDDDHFMDVFCSESQGLRQAIDSAMKD